MHHPIENWASVRTARKPAGRFTRSGCLFALIIVVGVSFSLDVLAQAQAAGGPLGTANAKGVPPDAGFYTNYVLSSDQTTVMWSVCGQTKKASGCDSSGSLGPFGKVATLMEGFPYEDVRKKIVVQNIYVVDVAAGANENSVVLYVYTKTDHITPLLDQVKVTLSATVNLPLIGGTAASAAMAANAGFMVIGTNQGPVMAKVEKSTLAVSQLEDFIPPDYVSAVTADWYGYITVTFSSAGLGDANFVLAPDGTPVQDGGEGLFMLNPLQGSIPSTFK
jgi:hypothetical protein